MTSYRQQSQVRIASSICDMLDYIAVCDPGPQSRALLRDLAQSAPAEAVERAQDTDELVAIMRERSRQGWEIRSMFQPFQPLLYIHARTAAADGQPEAENEPLRILRELASWGAFSLRPALPGREKLSQEVDAAAVKFLLTRRRAAVLKLISNDEGVSAAVYERRRLKEYLGSLTERFAAAADWLKSAIPLLAHWHDAGADREIDTIMSQTSPANRQMLRGLLTATTGIADHGAQFYVPNPIGVYGYIPARPEELDIEGLLNEMDRFSRIDEAWPVKPVDVPRFARRQADVFFFASARAAKGIANAMPEAWIVHLREGMRPKRIQPDTLPPPRNLPGGPLLF